jgi:hypothetical protein
VLPRRADYRGARGLAWSSLGLGSGRQHSVHRSVPAQLVSSTKCKRRLQVAVVLRPSRTGMSPTSSGQQACHVRLAVVVGERWDAAGARAAGDGAQRCASSWLLSAPVPRGAALLQGCRPPSPLAGFCPCLAARLVCTERAHMAVFFNIWGGGSGLACARVSLCTAGVARRPALCAGAGDTTM